MAIIFDCQLPIPSELPAPERLTRLTRLKNALIGHSQRKLVTLRSAGLHELVLILREQPGATAEEAFSLCTQTASILGALSTPTPEAVSTLLSVQAHSTLISTFTRLLDPKLPSVLPLAQQHKLAETLLRALKTLYVDLSRVVGPRAWGTDLVGGMVTTGERKDVRLQWQGQASWKGKGKDEGMDLSADGGLASLQIMADRALDELFQTRETYAANFSPSTSQPGAPTSGQRRPSGILAILLQLLVESSYLQHVPAAEVHYQLSAATRPKMADLICTLLAGTVRLPSQRLAVLGGEGATVVLSAIHRLIETGTGKVQEAALTALSALARDFRRLLVVTGSMEQPHLMTSFISDLCNSTLPSLALAAVTCRTVLYKTMRGVQYSTSRPEEVEPLVHILLSLIEKDSSLRAQAAFTLTYLISDSEELQMLAVNLKVLSILRTVLEQPPLLDQPYATPSSLEEVSRTSEGALLALAVLCSKLESHRHGLISASLLPLVVSSLSSPSAGVRAAACHCIRGLGRSVNVLRTSLVDTNAGEPLLKLLKDEDAVVKITAAATVTNLLLEFSPMRQVLIDQGCIEQLCELVKSSDLTLRVNALWALKNASYQSSPTFKRSMMERLGWWFLAELIETSSEEIAQQALGVLRNITCTYGNDPVTGLAESEIGEGRMMSILEACATSGSGDIVIGALYTIVNLGMANEVCRLAVASRTPLLRAIIVHLNHPDAETRTAAVWCIINLCHTDRTSFHARARRPREILDKLKAMGVDEELRRLREDEALDVLATIKKAIAPVPTAADFIDIILSSTQRKTPTVIHNGFKITRIRSFYMRKIKFTQQAFEERLDKILGDFPIMDNLHPFLSSLLNVLYDKNHYKLALGQLNTARHLIVSVGKDYCRLVKFGDSLFRCKQLKKAALGRMATIMRRQKDPLAYLEEVRQHMSRLPTIDPTTRTLLICGYPNVGKSSFVNKVTRADVDVQPYAFTTKSLFVGHMDYKYLRWQVIDTPGVLDHPLEEMNTIEMQSITALAHLRSCVLYFMDLSEQCGYTVEAQCQLYQSIKPLFTNKPTFIVCNKIDVMRRSELDPARKAMVDAILNEGGVTLLEISTVTEEGVMDVRNKACDALLAHRVESKEKTKRVENVANRVRVSVPVARDGVKREPFIPAAVATRKAYDKADPERRRLERDEEEENGGAGAFSVDMKKNYLLKNDEWKYDIIPEIQNGKNVADFIDPDIVARLEELEAEEERLEAAGFYDDDSEEDSDEEAIRTAASAIRDKKANIRMINHQKNKLQNRPTIPRTVQTRTLSDMTAKLAEAGYDPSNLEERARVLAKARGLTSKAAKRSAGEMEVDDEEGEGGWADEDEMDVEEAPGSARKKQKTSTSIVPKGKRMPAKDRQTAGLGSAEEAAKAIRLRELYQRGPNMLAKASESDRHIRTKMPKHLFSGKRKAGKTNRR